tara:strand:+ start:1014 stop:1400 length:387 start_codon:yes stop_codon:yes gene_type:complete
MRNFKNNRRRFRSNSYERNLKINSSDQNLNSNLGNISDFRKKNFSRNNFNSPKLIQKYMDLAREALSSGDKILYENYLQHADHFIRISDNNSNSTHLKNGSPQAANKESINKVDQEENTKQEDQLKAE